MGNAVVDDLRKRAVNLRQNVESRRANRAVSQAALDSDEAEDVKSLKMADDLDAAANQLSQ
jgi:hypothetical protein